jgi:hypothetical protein
MNVAICICLADSSPLAEKSALYKAVALSTTMREQTCNCRHADEKYGTTSSSIVSNLHNNHILHWK